MLSDIQFESSMRRWCFRIGPVRQVHLPRGRCARCPGAALPTRGPRPLGRHQRPRAGIEAPTLRPSDRHDTLQINDLRAHFTPRAPRKGRRRLGGESRRRGKPNRPGEKPSGAGGETGTDRRPGRPMTRNMRRTGEVRRIWMIYNILIASSIVEARVGQQTPTHSVAAKSLAPALPGAGRLRLHLAGSRRDAGRLFASGP